MNKTQKLFAVVALLAMGGIGPAHATPRTPTPRLDAARRAATDRQFRKGLRELGQTLYLSKSENGLVVIPEGMRYQRINHAGLNAPYWNRIATTRLGALWQKANWAGEIYMAGEKDIGKTPEQIAEEVSRVKADAAAVRANRKAFHDWARSQP